ncbi:MAG: hypothetical protein K2J82_10300 [Muribaculaceae bacterium]|nr:hypothetical protein [Muribaculaceae bacterium]
MKTKNLLTRISASALFAAAALLPAALTSCSSDSEPAPNPDPIPEGMARLNLSFSAPEISTRGTANLTDDEKTVSSVWVYFFKKNDSGTFVKEAAFAINSTTDGTTDSATGATFSNIETINQAPDDYQPVVTGMNIAAGTYHVYVLANMDNYYDDFLDPANETAFLAESFTSGTQITNSELPMAADKTALTVSGDGVSYSSTGTYAGDIVITSGQVDVKADLTILCSKVRYTIFFDNTAPTGTTSAGFSYPIQSLEVTSLKLNKANSVTPLFTATPESLGSTDNIPLDAQAVEYPTDFAAWTGGDQFGADLTDTEATTTGKIAYQGTLYLTENLESANDNKTQLSLSASLDAGKDTATTPTYTIYLPNSKNTGGEANTLTRGCFYDVMGKITSQGMAFEVRIKPWSKVVTDYHPL